MGTITIITSTKLLIFEAHTLVVANIKSEVGRKDDVTTHCVLPSAEREGENPGPTEETHRTQI